MCFASSAISMGVARAVVRGVLDAVANGCPGRRLWLRTRVRVVNDVAHTFGRQHFGMQSAAEAARVDELFSLPSEGGPAGRWPRET